MRGGGARRWSHTLVLWTAVFVGVHCVAAARKVTVMTFNVDNYLAENRIVDGRFERNYPKPESEKKALRRLIEKADPDILVLQEMGTRPYLEELREDLANEGDQFPYSAWMEASDRVRHLAALSKLKISSIHRFRNLDFSYLGKQVVVKRGVLQLVFRDHTGPWSLFVVHLKSRYTTHKEDPESEIRRLDEARAVAALIAKEFPERRRARYLVAGDFNAAPGSAVLAAFLGAPGHPWCGVPDVRDSRGLDWTYLYRKTGERSRMDYVLVSAGLWPSLVPKACSIPDEEPPGAASDHRPVVVTLDFSRLKKRLRKPTKRFRSQGLKTESRSGGADH